MKILGWILFSASLLIFIWKGLSLLIMFADGIQFSRPTEIIGTILLICVSIILAGVGWKLSHPRAKITKTLPCSYCGITNGVGYKFCGNCGNQLKR